jgi:hypothetical protein
MFYDTNRFIKKWKPEKFSNENQYRNDLVKFLRKQEFDWYGEVIITKEDGRGLCDIAINQEVGIELKKDLKKKSEVDRLSGQIIDYKRQYDNLIILLVGKTNEDTLDLLKGKIKHFKNNYDFDEIKIIDKGSEAVEKDDNDDWF